MIEDDRLQKKQQVIEYLKRFPFYKWAAKSIAIDEETLKNWRDADEDFSHRVEIARAEGVRYFGGRATPDLILKSADPETFKERKEIDLRMPKPLLDDVQKNDVTSETTKAG